MKKIPLILIVLCLASLRCGISNAIRDASTQVAASLDDAINKLGAESANIQRIMEETLSSLPDDVQATIRADISNTFQRAIATVGTEFRCNADFIRTRLRQALQRLKAKILGSSVPVAEPQFCSLVPVSIDMDLKPEQRNKIEVFGYDFDVADVRAVLFNGTNELDVTQFLTKTTHYHLLLNLGGNGVTLNLQSTKIVLRYNNQTLSTIQVIQDVPDICETKTRSHTPNTFTLIPEHIRGDKEFNGAGPAVHVGVRIINRGTHVDAFIIMDAKETGPDHTRAMEFKTITVFTPDPGFEVTEIVGPDITGFDYTDNDHAEDIFGGSGPVSKYVFMGDGEGDDAGILTRVDVHFSKLTFTIKENRDCVDGNTLRTLIKQNALSDQKMKKIKAVAPKILEVPTTGN